MIRSSRLVASTGLAVLLLSGCGSGSVRPGAAALVGDERITVDTLQQVVERGLEDPQAEQQLGQDRSAFQRQVLSRLVTRELLQAAADREGVTVSDGDVDRQLQDFVAQAGDEEALEQQAAQNGISPQDLPELLRDIVLEQALGDQLTADEDVPAAQLESLYEQAVSQGQLDPGTTSLEQATPLLRRAALQQRRTEATGELLRDVAGDLGITVNPRFGRWDPETNTIEAVEDPNGVTTSSPEDGAEAPTEEAPTGEAPPGEQPTEEQPLIEETPAPEGE